VDYFKELENWAAALKSFPERVPRLIKLRQEVFAQLINNASASVADFTKIHSARTRLDDVNIQVDSDLECDYIIYDQYGKEMKRK
jgi:hypothetical protein